MQIVSPSEQIKSTAFAHSAATTSKTPLVINSRVLIPLNTADAAARNVFVYEARITEAKKAAAQAWAVGNPIYFAAGTGEFTTTPTANTLCGHALEVAGTADIISGAIAFNAFAA